MNKRYSRNILVPEIGEAGQSKLAAAKVAIVGLGGLGSPAAMYLAAAGVGTLGLIDGDVVDESNLQRQLLHSTADIGRVKVDSAEEFLSALNPNVKLRKFHTRINDDNADDILQNYDYVVDATDNFPSKFLLNDTCFELDLPLATAGILGLSGQMLMILPGKGPCLRCAIGDVPPDVPTTATLGVLGSVPGILGSLQASSVIGHIVGYLKNANRLHTVCVRTMRLRTLELQQNANCVCNNNDEDEE